jgi:hypothetical protein
MIILLGAVQAYALVGVVVLVLTRVALFLFD